MAVGGCLSSSHHLLLLPWPWPCRDGRLAACPRSCDILRATSVVRGQLCEPEAGGRRQHGWRQLHAGLRASERAEPWTARRAGGDVRTYSRQQQQSTADRRRRQSIVDSRTPRRSRASGHNCTPSMARAALGHGPPNAGKRACNGTAPSISTQHQHSARGQRRRRTGYTRAGGLAQ